MPVDKDIKKVLIIGSGPIQIGPAAEFDYSGSQACKSLREEGIETVLVNSNPATIQTDMDMADVVYTEPLTPELVNLVLYTLVSPILESNSIRPRPIINSIHQALPILFSIESFLLPGLCLNIPSPAYII